MRRFVSLIECSLLLAGAGCGSTPMTPPDACAPPPPNAADLQMTVFSRSCSFSSCHNAASHKADMDLSSMTATCGSLVGRHSCEFPSRLRVDPANPDDSVVMQKLTCPSSDCTATLGPTIDGGCPSATTNGRMPLQNPPLPDCEITVIRTWISMDLPGCPMPALDGGVDAAPDAPPPDAPVDAPVDRRPRG